MLEETKARCFKISSPTSSFAFPRLDDCYTFAFVYVCAASHLDHPVRELTTPADSASHKNTRFSGPLLFSEQHHLPRPAKHL